MVSGAKTAEGREAQPMLAMLQTGAAPSVPHTLPSFPIWVTLVPPALLCT